jgi:X-X-X-Leu-X-X-Gly heptad repeat protein
MSRPIWSDGIASDATVVGGASALNSGATTMSVGSTRSTPFAAACSM